METFSDYTKQARDDFVKAVNSQDWSTEMRTVSEDILIAYDQQATRITELQRENERLRDGIRDLGIEVSGRRFILASNMFKKLSAILTKEKN